MAWMWQRYLAVIYGLQLLSQASLQFLQEAFDAWFDFGGQKGD
jgi:hypothetical protein